MIKLAYFIVICIINLQALKAQIFQSITPQSNCSKGLFVDYIADGKLNNSKTILNVVGQLITSPDSILSINFYVEKSFIIVEKNKQLEKEACTINLYSATFNSTIQNIYFEPGRQEAILIIRPNILPQKNNLAIAFNLPNTSRKEIEFILVCEVVFKTGCKYIKRQKVIL